MPSPRVSKKSSDKKLISACMITKNEGEYLKYSIESFIDYVDELIVIDDNSTDNTEEIVKSFPNATFIQGEYNGDKAKQRNTYITLAKGDWIFCPDGDEVYWEEDMKWFRKTVAENPRMLWIPVRLLNFWKDYNHVIHGPVFDGLMQRMYKNLPGIGHYDTHHSVSIRKGTLLSTYARKNGMVSKKILFIPHYSYCKKATGIRKKVMYYMNRDNENAITPEQVNEYALKHPYFSEKYNQPRHGKGGLSCAGNVHKNVDRVIKYIGSHPKPIRKHPKFRFFTEYSKNMNKYMETHWQFHNHLTEERHQKRITFAGKHCTGKTIEIGCANGFSTSVLNKSCPDATFDGVEATDWGFAEAVKKYPNLQFYKAYGENLPFFANEYDTVLLSEIIEHVENPRALADEAWRCCKKRLVITHPAMPAGATCDPDHKRYFSKKMMEEFCKPYGKVTFTGTDKKGNLINDPNRTWFGVTIIEKE